MPTLDVNGTTLFYEDTGGSGPPLLFSHGLLWSARMFEAQIAHFQGRFRVIAWDHRGQGRSADHDAPSVPVELVTADALALMDTLGLDAVHFAGLSMGGFVGMRLAARHPARVRSLVLMETTADPEPLENVPRYGRLNFVARWLGLGLVANPVMNIMFSKTFITDPAKAADRERWRKELLQNRRTIVRAVQGIIERAGVADECPRIVAPTTVLVGEEDVATVPAKAERLVSLIPGAVLERIPRAGHSSSVEQPELVIAAMERHFSRLAATS
jgi:pimeloyl-ACP methyl ester carboxylesterase